jgi:2-oxoisovalerate dehydrogenase E1 component alpha subunit
VQAHTNADDASRYRTEDEVTPWLERDPLKRAEAYLTSQGVLDNATRAKARADADDTAAYLREGLMQEVRPDPAELFAHVYAEPTPQLREQAEFLADELAREEA